MIDLYPSIDLLDGDVVRLRRGDYDAPIEYDADAVSTALAFVEDGARWIHVVDLDAARFGVPVNRKLVLAITAAVAGAALVQTGGGVRSIADVEALARGGVGRVVLGTAAVRSPDLVADAATVVPVAVGLDHRDGELAMHGWTESAGMTLLDAIGRYADADAFVVTNIATDGTLDGPDLGGLAEVAGVASAPIIASGGVGSLDDVRALGRLGDALGGVIVGRALYEARFTVADALAALDRAAS